MNRIEGQEISRGNDQVADRAYLDAEKAAGEPTAFDLEVE